MSMVQALCFRDMGKPCTHGVRSQQESGRDCSLALLAKGKQREGAQAVPPRCEDTQGFHGGQGLMGLCHRMTPRPHQAEPGAWCVLNSCAPAQRPPAGNGVSEGRDLFKEHLVLFREDFSSFFSSSELSATDVFSSSSFSSLFISLVPEETLLLPSPPGKPAKEAEPCKEIGDT